MRYCIVVCLVLLLIPTYGQHRCGFDQKIDRQISSNPLLIKDLEEQERRLRSIQNKRSTVDDQYVIPVVVHILHLGEELGEGSNVSDAQIFSAIDQLNQAFAGSGRYTGDNAHIQFALAAKSPTCEYSNGIVRTNLRTTCSGGDCYLLQGITAVNEMAVKNQSIWPSKDYLNIWVVHMIDGKSGSSGIQGFAAFPGSSNELDGVVIQAQAFGYDPDSRRGFNLSENTRLGTILVHEVGHSLGLYHSFEGDDYNRDGIGDRCPSADGCGLFNGDCVADTPPHRRSNGSCDTRERNICDGGGKAKLYIHNFMDYSGEECQLKFTNGQISRMRAVLATSRSSWANSNKDIGLVYGQSQKVNCSPQTLNLSNAFGLGTIEFSIGDFVKSSGNAVEDGGYVDDWCSLIFGKSGQEYPIEVITGSGNAQNIKIFCDYNADGDFGDPNELILDSRKMTVHSGKITIPNTAKKDIPLRLRIISAYAGFTISDACFRPYYGQVEDYSLVVDASQSPDIISFTQQGDALAWVVANDHLNSHYEVEYSNDPEGVFHEVQTVHSVGQTQAKYQSKGFGFGADHDVYYRLKMVGVNGVTSYSQVIRSHSMELPEDRIRLYPNPTYDEVSVLDFANPELAQQLQQVAIVDNQGKMVKNLNSDLLRASGEIPLSLTGLSSGMYYVRIVLEDQVLVKKISKM